MEKRKGNRENNKGKGGGKNKGEGNGMRKGKRNKESI